MAFAVSNDCIFLATSRNFVLRHDTERCTVAEIEASRSPDARVRRLFVDPLGAHALVSVQTGSSLETLYVDQTWKKVRPIAKLKNIVVSSVAWPPVQRASALSEVVIGTDKGALYELSLEGPKKEKVQQLCTLRGDAAPVAGLVQVALVREPGSGVTGATDRLVLALSGMRLHVFRGGPTLEALFASYTAASLHAKEPKALDLPIEQGAAQLQLLAPPKQPDASAPEPFTMPAPTEFAILSPSGVYYGHLNLSMGCKDELSHLEAQKLLPAGALQHGTSPIERPLSLALTQHHLVLLYPSRLQFVNRISKGVVQQIPLERFVAQLRGAMALPLGLCRDPLAGRVLVLAGDDAYEVDASQEDRDLWKIFLEQGDYHAALPYCRTAGQRNKVYLLEADALLADGKTCEAAALYGKVTSATPPFEDLALRMMDTGDPDALRCFLVARLGTLGPDDRAQATMVATWLLELLLDRANRAALRRRSGAEGEAQCADADAEVQLFLQDRVEVLDPGTTITLLEGYGRGDDLLTYARARGDHEATLELLVQRGEAERAMDVLRKPSVNVELAYRYAPALVALAPAQTVQSWIESTRPLDPRRLLPALLHLADASAPHAARLEALRYVRHCVTRLGSTDPALHNFAVALLVLEAEHEVELLEHLATARDVMGRPLYDAVHALRLCREHGRQRATVALLAEVGLWEDAVALALTVDPQLAEEVAGRPEGDEALTRKLWLTIARHIVGGGLAGDEAEKKAQVREVSRVLDLSSGAVRIEDVLPLFPDFVEIGAFRDAICASLEKYNEEMERLRTEMGLATRTAAALRESLEAIEGRVGAVDLEGQCASCKRPLHQQPPATAGPSGGALPRVFLFPTGNAFHGSCLCWEAAELAPPPQRARIVRLAGRLAGLAEGASLAPAVGSEPAVAVVELRRQLEDEVAVDDPYCGEIVARHVTKPLILPEEAEAAASWAL